MSQRLPVKLPSQPETVPGSFVGKAGWDWVLVRRLGVTAWRLEERAGPSDESMGGMSGEEVAGRGGSCIFAFRSTERIGGSTSTGSRAVG